MGGVRSGKASKPGAGANHWQPPVLGAGQMLLEHCVLEVAATLLALCCDPSRWLAGPPSAAARCDSIACSTPKPALGSSRSVLPNQTGCGSPGIQAIAFHVTFQLRIFVCRE